MAEKPDWQATKPLGNVTCSSFDCERDLHCFRKKRPKNASYRNGRCVACDVDLIDWERLDRRDLADATYTFRALKYEMVRHFYWHKELDDQALRGARRQGHSALEESAEKRIRRCLGKPSSEIFRDGTQTPKSGNVIYYAQHATATCCRKCAEEWHGIPRERRLTGDEVAYMVQLLSLYMTERVPDLSNGPADD